MGFRVRVTPRLPHRLGRAPSLLRLDERAQVGDLDERAVVDLDDGQVALADQPIQGRPAQSEQLVRLAQGEQPFICFNLQHAG